MGLLGQCSFSHTHHQTSAFGEQSLLSHPAEILSWLLHGNLKYTSSSGSGLRAKVRDIWGFALVLPSPYLLFWDTLGPGELFLPSPCPPPPSGDYVFKKGRVRAAGISFKQPSEGKSGLSLGGKKKGLALVLPLFLFLLCSSLLRP